AFVSWAMKMSQVLTWLPFTLPAKIPILAATGSNGVVAGAMIASVVLFPLAAVTLSAWLVRGGLVTVSGAYTTKRRAQVRRSQTAATVDGVSPRRHTILRGIIAK